MEIRRVRPDEAAGLREIRLRALRDAPEAYFSSPESEEGLPPGHWEEWATGADKAMFVAVEDGEWLGMAGAVAPPDKVGTVSLWWLWVAPDARGRGLARRLLEARAEWARARGASRLELAIAESNDTVITFYRGLGFVPTGERRSMASDPTRTGVFMARPL
jgi:ribosomal protein S18 acetylase RimI-like enzyme